MYAVLETGSKQYRVAAGDTLEIERRKLKPGSHSLLTVSCWLTTTASSPWARPPWPKPVLLPTWSPKTRRKENRVQII